MMKEGYGILMLTAVKEDTNQYRTTHPDYDGLWKKIIEELFQEFMDFFAPDLYPEIDFEAGIDFAGTELLPFILDTAMGKRYTDKLAKVKLKNGKNQYVHVHIEVQAVGDKEFTDRMFEYFYRIYENNQHDIYSIALLTDASREDHRDRFKYSFYGTTLTYEYNTYRFHEQNVEELKKSSNPFALVVLAGIYASEKITVTDKKKKSERQKQKEREEARLRYKQKLTNLVFDKYAHRPKYLSALLYFIDYIMKLPAALQKQFYESLSITLTQNKKEEKRIMGMEDLRNTPTFGRLISDIEKEATEKGMERGMKQGIEQGIEQGMSKGREKGIEEAGRNFAKKLLARDYSDEEIVQLTSLELGEVTKLRRSLEH
ncbi:Rpn family recombination-promoting nuclease/putative transposase [Gracilibacillus phocaeensis]|uniref:Rpn family recombination-promoting nuclease/putative transposase n=1 Tax=Gracilibacillus phocaeensis TaxID=2042304 RepID=UPI0010313D5F|nr:Rpn family recombination-promoting nuclease/putative transposase [Gracilibacillus phocaeensis]